MEKGGEAFKPMSQRGTPILPHLLRYFKTAGVLLFIWSLGYYNFSPSWVMLATFFSLFNEEYYRKIKLAKFIFAQQSDENERQAILARSGELPSWVFFPDVERAEWMNKMIRQMWPYIGEYVKEVLKTTVQPSVENSLPNSLKPFKFEKINLGSVMIRQMWPYIGEYVKEVLKTTVQPSVENSLPNSLKPFKFEKINLGSVPPRIGGVKVYTENLKRDEILLDLELLYASDAEIKVAVRGLTAGIKNLTIQGRIHVMMKPLCNKMPIIGGLQVYFLNPPAIDFDLTNTANLLDLPLLSNTLRSIIADQIGYYLVLPNKIPVQLVQDIETESFKFPLPQGVLRVHVIAARELKRADFKLVGKGKSDPYVKVYIGAQVYKTKVIQDTIAPVWNEYFEGVVDQKFGQFAEFEVLDEDPGDDDELGEASLDISNVCKEGSLDTWLPLENVETGMIHVRAIWLHLSSNPDDLDKVRPASDTPILKSEGRRTIKDKRKDLIVREDGQLDTISSPVIEGNEFDEMFDDEKMMDFNRKQLTSGTASEDHLSSAILLVTLDSAKALARSKKSMSEPSPYAKLSLGNVEHKSIPKPKTTDPRWEQNFEFLVMDPRHQEFKVELLDSYKEAKLGSVLVPLADIMKANNMTMSRHFPVRGGTANTKLYMTLRLRILTTEAPPEPTNPPPPMVSSVDPEEYDDQPAEADSTTSAAAAPEQPVTEEKFQIGGDSDAQSVDSSIIEKTPTEGLRHRLPTQLSTTSTTSDSGLGKIQVTIRYSPQRGRLILVVHQCKDLIPCDDDDLADPYVRIYLMPEKSSSSKRKTQIVKNNLHPIYDETFDWNVSMTEVPTRSIDISVKNDTSVFSRARTHMGCVSIDLAHFDLTKATTDWFYLQEFDDDEKSHN